VALSHWAAAVPVEPDRPEAREWLIDELTAAEYQNAQPNWLDRAAQALLDWITSLQGSGAAGPPAVGLLIVALVVAAIVVLAFFVFGRPRANGRSGVRGSLFGEDDDRSAEQLRRSADAAAAAGDPTAAIAERFRAIARALSERTILTLSPGTTAHGFADRASAAFPPRAARRATAAEVFDAVRYLDRPGTLEQYAHMVELDDALEAARPRLEAVPT
jgi:hypothetical protein